MATLRPPIAPSATSTSDRADGAVNPFRSAHAGAHSNAILSVKPSSRQIGRNAKPTVHCSNDSNERVTDPESAKERGGLTMSQPSFLLCVIAAFGAVAYDVFAKDSGQYLQAVDLGMQLWVEVSVPSVVSLISAHILSNITILLSCVGWIAVTGLAITNSPIPGFRRAAIATAVYLAPGFGGGGDVPLVHLLKEFFKRGRPLASTHHSYSFPSGHTTCSFYMSGALLFILLPGLLEVLKDSSEDKAATGSAIEGKGSPDTDDAAAGLPLTQSVTTQTWKATVTALTAIKQASLPLWIFGGTMTAVGRVIAEAHWVSDTMAGALLGSGLLSVACMIDQSCAGVSIKQKK